MPGALIARVRMGMRRLKRFLVGQAIVTKDFAAGADPH